MCLADANLLAIRRLLSRSLSVAHSTTTPGPPLPPGHPSPSLLAKLHLHVYTLYDEARTLVKTVSSSTASGPRSNLTGAASSSGEIVLPLRRYLSDGRTLALALSYKWLGVDAGERASPPATGDALGYLALAAQELDALGDKDKGLKKLKGFGKGREAGKGRKGKVQEERESTEAFRSAYKKVNDTVSLPVCIDLCRAPRHRAYQLKAGALVPGPFPTDPARANTPVPTAIWSRRPRSQVVLAPSACLPSEPGYGRPSSAATQDPAAAAAARWSRRYGRWRGR